MRVGWSALGANFPLTNRIKSERQKREMWRDRREHRGRQSTKKKTKRKTSKKKRLNNDNNEPADTEKASSEKS